MGVARDGLVQAVKILSTEQVVTWTERRAYRSALTRLIGKDLGSRVGAWARYWKRHAARLLAERAKREQERDGPR